MFGWFSKKEKLESDRLVATSRSVISSFGEVLEKESADVIDISKLPYEKSILEKAFLIAIPAEKDPELIGHLTVAYMSLSNFQPLSDVEKDVVQRDREIMQNVAEISGEALVDEIASIGETMTALRDRVSAEMADRRQDIEQMLMKSK